MPRRSSNLTILTTASRAAGTYTNTFHVPPGSRVRVNLARTAGAGSLDFATYALLPDSSRLELATSLSVGTDIGASHLIEVPSAQLQTEASVAAAAVTFGIAVTIEADE
jgi:hypothetical protein